MQQIYLVHPESRAGDDALAQIHDPNEPVDAALFIALATLIMDPKGVDIAMDNDNVNVDGISVCESFQKKLDNSIGVVALLGERPSARVTWTIAMAQFLCKQVICFVPGGVSLDSVFPKGALGKTTAIARYNCLEDIAKPLGGFVDDQLEAATDEQ